MTIRSMTAFARVEHQAGWGNLVWEIRSVNHRYLDIGTRLPEELRSLEAAIREAIQTRVKRGKVDCHLHFQTDSTQNQQFRLNQSVAEQLWQTIQAVNHITGNTHPPDALAMLNWQGILETVPLDTAQISTDALAQLDIGLTQLISQREREGQQLAELIAQRCTGITQEVAKVRANLPDILQAQRLRLETKLAEFKETLDAERVEQEMVLLAQKSDVNEELDRMEAHISEVEQILRSDEPVGRRLDFIVQELHREANTLGAKANHLNTTRSAVELKVLIEQVREQTQNIE